MKFILFGNDILIFGLHSRHVWCSSPNQHTHFHKLYVEALPFYPFRQESITFEWGLGIDLIGAMALSQLWYVSTLWLKNRAHWVNQRDRSHKSSGRGHVDVAEKSMFILLPGWTYFVEHEISQHMIKNVGELGLWWHQCNRHPWKLRCTGRWLRVNNQQLLQDTPA